MPDSAAIIGKVAVKVIPDTDKFKAELKKKLNAIEKELKSEGYSVKVLAELDGSKIKEQAKKIQEEAKSALKDISIRVDLDNQDSVKAGIAKLEAELAKLDEKEIKVTLDKASLKAEIAALSESLDKIHHIKLQVDESNMESVKRAITKLDAELEKMAEVTVKVDYDKASLEKARAEYQKILDDAAAKAKADADKALEESMQRNQLLLNRVKGALDEIKFAPGVDEEKLAATKREIEVALLKIEDLSAKIDVELDPVAKRKLELEMDALRAKIRDMTAKVKTEVDEASKVKTEAALAVLTRDRRVVIDAVVNSKGLNNFVEALSRLSGFRDGHQFVDELRQSLSNLDLAIPKISTVATAVGGIGAAATSSIGFLAALSASLASIAAGGLALPGIIGGIGIGMIATMVVLKDFNKQFSELYVSMDKKTTAGSWWKQLQDQMSSNFWSIAKQPIQEMVYTLFPLLAEGLKGTSTALGGFFSGLATGLKNALGPRMQGMFKNLNDSIVIATGSTGALATSMGVLGTLGASYLPRLAQWFTDIANKTAAWLTEAEKTGKLKEMVDTAIDRLKALGRILWDTAGIFADIARAAQAALGEDALTKMARGVKHLHDVTKSADFQRILVDVFSQANAAMGDIVHYAGPALEKALKNIANLAIVSFRDIGVTIGEVGGGILDAFNNPRLQGAIANLFNTLRDFSINLRPAWDSVGEAIGSVLDLVNTFINVASPGVSRAIENLAGWVSTLADAMQPIVTGLGGVLNDTLDGIAPGITNIVNAVSDFAKGDGGKAIVGFFKDLGPLVQDISDWLGEAATQLAAWGNENMPKIRENLQPVIEWLQRFLKEHGQEMIDIMKTAGDTIVGLSGALGELMPVIGPLVEATGLLLLTNKIKDYGTAVAEMIKKIPPGGLVAGLGLAAFFAVLQADENAGGFEGFIGKVRELGSIDLSGTNKDGLNAGEQATSWWDDYGSKWLEGFQNWVSNDTAQFRAWWDNDFWPGVKAAPGEFWSWFSGGWKTMYENLKTDWSGYGEWIHTKLNELGQWFQNKPTEIKNWFVGGWQQMYENLKSDWSGYGEWIHTKLDELGAWFQNKPTEIKNWFVGGWKTMYENLKSDWSGYGQWLSGKLDELVAWFKSLPGKITTALGNVKDTLKNAALDIMQGFLDWLSSKWKAVKDFFGNLTDMIPDWKGPRNRDKTLLQDAGTLIMDGFLNGLESRYDAVRDSLKGLTDDISGTEMGTLKAPTLTGMGGRLASAANGGVANGMTSSNSRILNYYAAPGSSISSEEDLFAASNRVSRMGW